MATDPNDKEYIVYLRQTVDEYLAASKLKQAQETLLEIKKLTPNDATLLVEIGDLCLRLDNAFGAKYYYEHARRIDGSNVHIYSKLALIHDHKLNKPLEAEKYYKSIFIIDPTNSFAYFNIAKLYIKQNRCDDAHIAFKRCLEIDPHNALYHNEYGKFLEAMGDFQEAEWELKQAMLMDDDNKTYYDDYKRISAKLDVSMEGNTNIVADIVNIIDKRWHDEEHIPSESNTFSIRNIIRNKAQTLLFAFCRYNTEINMDITALCFMYYIGDYPHIIYDDTLSHLTDFGRMEVEQMLFALLCDGNEEEITVVLVQLLDVLKSVTVQYEVAVYYMSYLLSSATVVELYRLLKDMNDVDTVVDIACDMEYFYGKCNGVSFCVLIWKILCAESEVFYIKYRMKIANNNMDKYILLNKMESSDLSVCCLQDLRNIAMPLLFDEDTLNLVTTSPIGTICGLAAMIGDGFKDGYKVGLYWMEMELQLIPKRSISDNVNILLNNAMVQIWRQLNEDIQTAQFHYNILRVFTKKGICLKPLSVQWQEFYAIIAEIVLKDEGLKSIVLAHCLEQLRMNMFPKTNWKQCIVLLS